MSAALAYEANRPAAPHRLVWDLECVSGWDRLPVDVQASFLEKYDEAEARLPLECRGNPRNHPIEMAALNPFTGMVVCVALLDPRTGQGHVRYVAHPDGPAPLPPPGWRATPCATERDLLVGFWGALEANPDVQLAGYNTRRFDASYVFVRSYLLGVRCTMNALPYRYSTREHLDLFDVLGGWGNVRAPSLDVICRLTGIATSKQDLSGDQVQAAWDAGRIDKITLYCIEDVRAEAEALARWDATVGPVFGERRR